MEQRPFVYRAVQNFFTKRDGQEIYFLAGITTVLAGSWPLVQLPLMFEPVEDTTSLQPPRVSFAQPAPKKVEGESGPKPTVAWVKGVERRFWGYTAKTKRLSTRRTTDSPRFDSNYIEELGWLTPRETAALFEEDWTLAPSTDNIECDVDRRFDVHAPCASENWLVGWRPEGHEVAPRMFDEFGTSLYT